MTQKNYIGAPEDKESTLKMKSPWATGQKGVKNNQDRDTEDNSNQKMNLYNFAYFTLFITVKTTTKLSLEHSDKFDIESL